MSGFKPKMSSESLGLEMDLVDPSAVNLATETIKGIDTELCCEIAGSSFLQDLLTVLQPLPIQSDESSLHGNLLELITILLSSLSSFGL
ncbi:hypothetical protein BLNAU_12844 [Blattamonas nauphoetae]|uniref:Uncharacterized protein n=1 Tax=Blattamonas nauphoetae TaxID=2049346 RepID=A0ABQ9XQA2_9EUKA|nr:hypothetical protein BLNAU_12844 [Blattamonas nauphoetae]